jgi:hypothetical protein
LSQRACLYEKVEDSWENIGNHFLF